MKHQWTENGVKMDTSKLEIKRILTTESTTKTWKVITRKEQKQSGTKISEIK